MKSFIVALLAGLAATPAWAGSPSGWKTFDWEGMSVAYPPTWNLQQLGSSAPENRALRLDSGTTPAVTVMVNMSRDGKLGAAGETPAPADVGEAFCLPIVLNAAQKDEQKVAHIPTRIQVAGENAGAVLMTVEQVSGETRAFSSFHCFAALSGDRAVVGAVMSGGLRGRILKQAPFRAAVDQAYAVVDGIRLH